MSSTVWLSESLYPCSAFDTCKLYLNSPSLYPIKIHGENLALSFHLSCLDTWTKVSNSRRHEQLLQEWLWQLSYIGHTSNLVHDHPIHSLESEWAIFLCKMSCLLYKASNSLEVLSPLFKRRNFNFFFQSHALSWHEIAWRNSKLSPSSSRSIPTNSKKHQVRKSMLPLSDSIL